MSQVVMVLAACGHWWEERRPDGVKLSIDQPRVCPACRPDVRAAVGTSPQGFAMVPVTYLTEWTEQAE